jgi:hypothetical protein
MLQITSPLPISKIRYRAKKRGLKVRADGTGNFTVISTQTEPPRPLAGLDHVPLWVIEQVILTPLPEPPPRRKRMARLSESAPAVEEVAPVEAPTSAQANHGQVSYERSFQQLIRLLQERGGAR